MMVDRMLLYLRTNRSLEHETEALDRLTDEFPFEFTESDRQRQNEASYRHLNWLAFGEEEITWSDGLVLAFQSDRPAYEVAKRLAGALGGFRDWAILGEGNDCVESTGVGPIGTFMDRMGSNPVASIYVMAGEDDQRCHETGERLQARLGEDCARIFSFDDGQVLFFPDRDPPSITAQRHFSLLDRFEYWAVCDQHHEPRRSGSGGEAYWHWRYLPSLRFEIDEDED